MSNVTNASLKKAGVPPELWHRAKAICNSPGYRVSRQIVRFLDGPFAGGSAYFDAWDCVQITAPIKVKDQVGYYKREKLLYGKGATAKWVKI